MAVEASSGDGLGKNDTDGNKDGAGAGGEGNGNFEARAFGIFIAAAEAEAAFGEIFADGNLFLKAAVADGGEDAGFDARAVTAGNDALIDGECGYAVLWIANFGLGFDPDRRRVAKFADARDAFADFEGLQLELVEINDFAALAETALHEKARQSFFTLVRGGEVDVPEVGVRIENMNGVKEVIGRVLVDFGDHAGARAFPGVSFEVAAQVELLSHREFLVQAEDAPIAADEQGFHGLCQGGAGGRDPRGLHGHAEVDAVTLPESIG